jgi:hypothetical protein
MPAGEWIVYVSNYNFASSDPAEPFLQSYLYMYDYNRRKSPIFINEGEIISNHSVNGIEAVLSLTNNSDDENEVFFSIEIELAEGANVIETIALDFSGDESSDKRSVTFTLPDQSSVLQDLDIILDIKPGTCKNPLNIGSKGVLPVAVLGSAGFDVSVINPASIRLIGVEPLRSAVEDVAAPADSAPGNDDGGQACPIDFPDGFDDLVLKFDTQDIVKALEEVEEVIDGKVLTLTLTGVLSDGTEITGEDVVFILDRGKKKGK